METAYQQFSLFSSKIATDAKFEYPGFADSERDKQPAQKTFHHGRPFGRKLMDLNKAETVRVISASGNPIIFLSGSLCFWQLSSINHRFHTAFAP